MGRGGFPEEKRWLLLEEEQRKFAGKTKAADPVTVPSWVPRGLILCNTELMRAPKPQPEQPPWYYLLGNSCFSSPLEPSPTSHT